MVDYLNEHIKPDVVHLSTGLVVGYPPCPHIDTFKAFLEKRYGVKVVVGTHPIPQKYLDMHDRLGTWESSAWRPRIAPTMCDAVTYLPVPEIHRK